MLVFIDNMAQVCNFARHTSAFHKIALVSHVATRSLTSHVPKKIMSNLGGRSYQQVLPFTATIFNKDLHTSLVSKRFIGGGTPSPKDIRPPFSLQSATAKVQAAEDAWNSRDAVRVSKAYSKDSQWRNRDYFLVGRPAIVEFLSGKWERELDYRLRKALWAYTDNRIAVRFEYEYRNKKGEWFRAHGNENWEFDEGGLMRRRFASINKQTISEADLRVVPGESEVGDDFDNESTSTK